METMRALASRASVRGYRGDVVEREKLERIANAGNRAPNAGPMRFTVIADRGYLKEINDATLRAMKESGNAFLMERAAIPGYQPLYGAPALILVSAPPEGYFQHNAACAATAMTLAATDLGLGSCYVVSPTLVLDGANGLSSRLSLSAGYVPVCGVLVGYAGGEAPPAPHRGGGDNIDFLQ